MVLLKGLIMMMEQTADRHYESIWQHLSTVAFRQGWVDAGGIRTRYVQAGRADAPALIMLHGTGGTWEAYMANLGPHSQHFNCYAIDFMGCGYSDKPLFDYQISSYVEQVKAFMQAVGVGKASFIGISLGAWVATKFAAAYPELTEKITLNAAFGLSDDEETISGIIARRSNAYDNPTWDTIARIFENLILSPEKRIDDLVALRRATFSLPEAKAAARHVLAVYDKKYLSANLITPEDCSRIHNPALVVVSLKDKPLFVNTARRMAQLLPNARALEMDNVAHWPQFEDAETFNRENIAFLKSGR